jgi:hypothetical protein
MTHMTLSWHRSTRCSSGGCAETRLTDDGNVEIRNSTDPDGPILTFPPGQWQAFVDAVKGSGL